MTTLLIVEDSIECRETLTILCQEEGYTVLQANHGIEALAVLRSHPVDVMVTDVNMPHMNGNELAAETRIRYPQTKIIFLSGGGGIIGVDAHTLQEEMFRITGIPYTLQKPLQPPVLLDLIKEISIDW